MSADPIARGANVDPLITAQPTEKTSPNVPMNSVTYLRIVNHRQDRTDMRKKS